MGRSESGSAGEEAPPVNEAGGYMHRALQLAARGWGQTAPNPMVGAVLVRDSRVVGEGWHERFGEPHAEVNAMRAAGSAAVGAHLYVTLEPCAHTGKTPPCTEAIVAAGIRRVSIAALDPTTAGGGAAQLRQAAIDVDSGMEETAARELNAPFFFAVTSDRPWVTLKLALSSEGAIAPAAGADGARRQVWLTGSESRREVHRLRAGADAVAVGVGTILCDDPELTVRDFPSPRVPPTRVIFDRSGRTPLSAHVIRTARQVPTIIVARQSGAGLDALAGAGADVIVAADTRAALRALRSRGIYSLLVEGGAGLAGSMLDADVVDRVVLLQSPRSLGAAAVQAFSGARSPRTIRDSLVLRETRQLGSDLMQTFAVAGHNV